MSQNMSQKSVQYVPKHRIFADEAVPMSRKEAGGINKLSKRLSEWERKRGTMPKNKWTMRKNVK